MKQSVLRRLSRFLRPYQTKLLFLLALLIASNLLALVAPMLSGWAVGVIEAGPGRIDFSAVLWNCIGMLACYAGASILNYRISAGLISIGQRVSHDL